MTALRFFVPSITRGVVALLACGALVATYGVLRAHARHETVRLERALCLEQLRWLDRDARWVKPADPCDALKIVEVR